MEYNYYDLLQKPLEGFNPLDPEVTFNKIAKNLMHNYCIQCGKEQFYFAEIEFYYYKTTDQNKFDKISNWEGVTYDRNTNAGDLFYHLSGCDICFDSNINKLNKEFISEGGGILIRSLSDKTGKIITAGPMNCVNTMLNACGKEKAPYLSQIDKSIVYDINVCPTYRYLGSNDFKIIKDNIKDKTNRDGNLKLAYYNDKISIDAWNKARPSYYNSRFNLSSTNK